MIDRYIWLGPQNNTLVDWVRPNRSFTAARLLTAFTLLTSGWIMIMIMNHHEEWWFFMNNMGKPGWMNDGILEGNMSSGKRLQFAMENHHFEWVNLLFQWPYFQ